MSSSETSTPITSDTTQSSTKQKLTKRERKDKNSSEREDLLQEIFLNVIKLIYFSFIISFILFIIYASTLLYDYINITDNETRIGHVRGIIEHTFPTLLLSSLFSIITGLIVKQIYQKK